MGDPELAGWLIRRRRDIDAALRRRPSGPPVPPGSAEAEALRRFRTWASAALLGRPGAPALDGLKVEPVRTTALLRAWCQAAAEVAVPRERAVQAALLPLADRFATALRGTQPARRARGTPRSTRRAVIAAIDRVADAFLAIDTDSGQIADANPAAGSLLGVARDALIGDRALRFVRREDHELWWTQLGAAAEGGDPQRFATVLRGAHGGDVPVDASVTRYASRGRTLALIVARPS